MYVFHGNLCVFSSSVSASSNRFCDCLFCVCLRGLVLRVQYHFCGWVVRFVFGGEGGWPLYMSRWLCCVFHRRGFGWRLVVRLPHLMLVSHSPFARLRTSCMDELQLLRMTFPCCPMGLAAGLLRLARFGLVKAGECMRAYLMHLSLFCSSFLC
jgi:hypothetical protein